MKPWWQRCMWSALLNGAVWITPPPVHFISLFLPYFSGYTIAAERPSKGFVPSLQIGLVMGLTLGALVAVPGELMVLFISMFVSIDLFLWGIIVAATGLAIGLYTGAAASLGAFLAAYRAAATVSRKP